jgi:hypothetical protein
MVGLVTASVLLEEPELKDQSRNHDLDKKLESK